MCLTAVALAQELLTPGEQVLRELGDALVAADEERSVRLLAEVAELYRYPASPAEAAALLKLAGAATRAESPAVAAAALRTLGRSGAPAAMAHVEPLLRTVKPPPGRERVMLAAVEAAGRLRPPALVPALLRLAQKCPDLTIAGQALAALGEFHRAETSLRLQVAGKVLDLCQAARRRRARWQRLRAQGLRALQRLMGRKLNSVPQFTDWWRHARKKK
ncbi:MAG: HEAT repeat domain-containing protein [Planctomycetota bacterium]